MWISIYPKLRNYKMQLSAIKIGDTENKKMVKLNEEQ